MGIEQQPSMIYVDNKSAISIVMNQGYTARAKHIELRAHFVRDHVANGNITVEHVPSSSQLADSLTNGVPTPHFVALRKSMGIASGQVEGEC
jgi:hypothetical protein